MANKYRGEVTARLDGQDYTLCLTLGALAELEQAFGAEDMVALAARFEHGRLSAWDAIRVIGAGLRGAGHDVSDEQVAAMRTDEGASGFVVIVVDLLEATFGADEKTTKTATPVAAAGSAQRGAAGTTHPFPGTTP